MVYILAKVFLLPGGNAADKPQNKPYSLNFRITEAGWSEPAQLSVSESRNQGIKVSKAKNQGAKSGHIRQHARWQFFYQQHMHLARIGPQHFEVQVIHIEMVTLARHPAQMVGDQAADGVDILVREIGM
jgi:hypothetical protein